MLNETVKRLGWRGWSCSIVCHSEMCSWMLHILDGREREKEKRIINNYSLVDRFDWTRLINISPVPSLRGANLPSNLFAFPMADYCILLLG